jgi:hypothetical protein
MIIGQSSIAGTVDATAEKAAMSTGITYRYISDVDSVIRYTTVAGTDATATPATGDTLVAAGIAVYVTSNNGNSYLSVVRRSVDGVYTMTPMVGF